jgi:broad specificity phosphatase PhoE
MANQMPVTLEIGPQGKKSGCGGTRQGDSMRLVYFITHPEVVIDPQIPVPRWPLSQRGRERIGILLTKPWISTIGAVYCSTEQKAIDGAQLIASHLQLPYHTNHDLGEIDRSATGYLPHDEHMATAEAFFANPYQSIRGWERAIDAQQRITHAITRILHQDEHAGTLVIVSHGAVGMLHLCHLQQRPISQREQPPGMHGGCYYCFDATSNELVHSWQLIDG